MALLTGVPWQTLEYNKFVSAGASGETAIRTIPSGSAGGAAETTATQNLALGALSKTTALTAGFKLAFVAIHFTGAVSQTVTVTLISASGSGYNTVIDATLLSSNTDYFFIPEDDLTFASGNQISVTCTNSGTPAVTANCTIGTVGT